MSGKSSESKKPGEEDVAMELVASAQDRRVEQWRLSQAANDMNKIYVLSRKYYRYIRGGSERRRARIVDGRD